MGHCGCPMCAPGSHCLADRVGGVEGDTLPLQPPGTGNGLLPIASPTPTFLDREIGLCELQQHSRLGWGLVLLLQLRRVSLSCLKANCICQLFLLIAFDYVASSMGRKGVLRGKQKPLGVGVEQASVVGGRFLDPRDACIPVRRTAGMAETQRGAE